LDNNLKLKEGKMKKDLEIYNQMDWWHPKHSLLKMVPVKFNYFKEKIGNLQDLKILDLGCGGGLLSEEFAKYGAKVTGIDISDNSIKIANKHAKDNNLFIEYKVGSAENIPAINNLFDVVICADCLEHVEDIEKVISEISRVLKKDGIFCYDTINRNVLSKIIAIWFVDRILRWQYKSLAVTENNYKVHNWKKFIKPFELFHLLKKYNLKNQEVKGIIFAGIKNGNIKTKIGNSTKIAYIGYAQREYTSLLL